MNHLEEIIRIMNEPSKEDISLIKRAYDFASRMHERHYRLSGEPFILHSLETARALAELNLDSTTIAAGLLHDVLEDGSTSEEEIEKEFGKEILFLIQGVTKLGKIRYRGSKRYTESLRKFFVAVSQDIRVLMIKFCDRFHNMRTLEYQRPEKRYRIALETLEIYAPLANRLGMRKLCRELENLAFPYVYPQEYTQIRELLKQKKRETIPHLEKFTRSIIKTITKKGMVSVRTDYRLKSYYSLYHKLKRKGNDIEKIYDISALRIIVPTVEDCYSVLGAIHGVWRPLPGRIKDYIAFSKPNGYRSIHTTIFTGDGGILEVQIRTDEMHRESEYGIATHFAYKDGGEKRVGLNYLSWLSKLLPKKSGVEQTGANSLPPSGLKEIPSWLKELAHYDKEIEEQQSYIRDLKADFFEMRVFVFTPKGDVVDLPVDSSPIDFAYAIHSDVGDHLFGAKVNGKLVSLNTKLQNGDIVEIITKSSSHPTLRWFEFVKTATARRHIQASLERSLNPAGSMKSNVRS